MANTHGEKELLTDWPVTSGLTAGTTKTAGRVTTLVASEGSNVPRRYKEGMED